MEVTNEELRVFTNGLDNCMKRIGGGKVAMDSICIRKLVHSHPKAAWRYVEIHCFMAQSQPGYLQPALMVAVAYQIEFNDNYLSDMVADKAKELGVEDPQIGIRTASKKDIF